MFSARSDHRVLAKAGVTHEFESAFNSEKPWSEAKL